MSEVLQANIFFFITSIAVIVFTLLLCVLLYHLIKVVKSVRKVVDRIEEGSEVLAENLSHLSQYFAENSLIATLIRMFFRNNGDAPKRKSASRKTSTKSKKTTLSIKDED